MANRSRQFLREIVDCVIVSMRKLEPRSQKTGNVTRVYVIPKRNRVPLVALLALAFCNAAPIEAVEFNPETPIGPTVKRWGWDIKGSQNQTSTTAKADLLYDDVPANLIRIPIWVNAHFSNGSVDTALYSNEITSIRNALTENPHVEVFASVKLQGGDTFLGPISEPHWVTQGTAEWNASTGSIFGNPAPRPNPVFYSQLVADFFDYMASQGIDIDYIGLNNETDGALGVPRYIDTVDRLNTELGSRGYDTTDLQFVAPDTFSPSTAENILNNIISTEGRPDTFDIVGSHQYPATSNHTSDHWQTFSGITGGKDMWHTELHMNPSSSGTGGSANDNITRMRRGMGIMFSANLNGADSFVWWGGGSNTTKISQTLRREIIKSTLGGHAVASPSFDEQDSDPDAPLYQAYRQGDLLTIWIAHPEFADQSSFPIEFADGFIATEGTLGVSGTYWQGGAAAGPFGDEITAANHGNLAFTVNANQQGFTINTLHENSISKVSVVMTGRLVWNQGSGNFDQGFARSNGFQGVGATSLDPYGYSGTESLFIGNGAFVTLDHTTNMSSGNAVKSIALGTDQASEVIANRNGFGVFTINDAVNLTIGDGTTQVGNVGDLIIGAGGFQGQLVWNSSGTLDVEGKLRIGDGGQGFLIQNSGTVIAGNTGGNNKFISIGLGDGSDGSSYTLNNGTLVLGGGLVAGELRELRIGSDAHGTFTLGDGSGDQSTAVIETRRHIQIGHDGGNGTLAINTDGRIEQITDSAPFIVGTGGGQGAVMQDGGTVTIEHQLRIGNGTGSIGSYTFRAGVLDVAWDNSGPVRVGENGGTGTLRIEGTADFSAGAEFFLGHTDNTGSTGRLEIAGSNASASIANLDNALGTNETISWEADALGVTPLVVVGNVGAALFVELQHPSEIAATVNAMGDGIALELDLSQILSPTTLTLIDNQSLEPIQGLFENPIVPNDLYEEGETILGTGFQGIVSISYVGGTGNDVVLTLTGFNADFNGDARVDGSDYLIWQRGNGNAGGSHQGDANGDGLVNSADLEIWRSQYGMLPASTAQTSIPEPSSAILIAFFICISTTSRPRRHY